MTTTDSRPLFIRLTLPDGLEEALEGLAREVLRHHPDNIYEFAADHFEQQLKKRVAGKMREMKEFQTPNLENIVARREVAVSENEGQSLVDEDELVEVENIEGTNI